MSPFLTSASAFTSPTAHGGHGRLPSGRHFGTLLGVPPFPPFECVWGRLLLTRPSRPRPEGGTAAGGSGQRPPPSSRGRCALTRQRRGSPPAESHNYEKEPPGRGCRQRWVPVRSRASAVLLAPLIPSAPERRPRPASPHPALRCCRAQPR